jgi:hypothetical protein
MSHSILQQEDVGESNEWLVIVTDNKFVCYLAFYLFLKTFPLTELRFSAVSTKVTSLNSILKQFNVADTFQITAVPRISFNLNVSHDSAQELLETRPFLQIYI